MHMTARKGCSIVIAIVALIFCTMGSAFAYNVSGLIYGGSNPLSGATVTLKNSSTLADAGSATTDAGGAYTVTNVPDGSYTVSITPPVGKQFDVASSSVTVQGADAALNIALVPKPVDITGIVTTPDGTPVGNVGVFIFLEGAAFPSGGSAVTAADGSYTIHLEKAGSYDVTVSTYSSTTSALPSFYVPSLITNLDVTSAMTHRDIVLPIATVQGKTADADGKGIPNVGVYYWFQTDPSGATLYSYGYARATSDASGNYSVPLFAHSGYSVHVTPPAGSGVVQIWSSGLDIASDTTKDFTLTPAVPLSGAVTAPTALGISNVAVIAYDQATGAPAGYGVTDADGRYSIQLGFGTYSLTVSRAYTGDGVLPSNVPLPSSFYGHGIVQNIAVAGATSRDLTLPLVTLTGRTVDGSGNPVANVRVSFAELENDVNGVHYIVDTSERTSDQSGSFSVPLLAAPGYSYRLLPPSGTPFALTDGLIDVLGDTDQVFALSPAFLVTGKVTKSGGTPFGEVFVEITGQGATAWGLPISDADGNFTAALPAGLYNFTVYSRSDLKAGFTGYHLVQNFAVAGATTLSIEVPLVTLSGTLTDGSGAPVANEQIILAPHQENASVGSYYVSGTTVSSDSSGHYSLNLIAGTGYSLTFVSPSGRYEQTVKDQVEVTQDRVMDVALVNRWPLTINVNGNGTVTVSGAAPYDYQCYQTCTQYLSAGSSVRLTASADGMITIFGGWDGCDSFDGNRCSTTVSAAKTITATFRTAPPILFIGDTSRSVYTGANFLFCPSSYRAESFSITDRPSWATFNAGNGCVSGTPGDADAGVYSFVISASNQWGTTSYPTFTLNVQPLPKPTLSGSAATKVTAGYGYSFQPVASNADKFTITNKPPWANFYESNGWLGGIPWNANAGTYSNIVITATNKSGSVSLPPFSITVVAVSRPSLSGIPATRATTDKPYSFVPTAARAQSFNIVNRPSWASFNTDTGALTGTPGRDSLGTYSNIVISANNAGGTVALPAFSITVALPAPTISGTPATKVLVGTSYSFTPTASNATSFSIVNKPTWASFDTKTGALTGTPASLMATNYVTIKATNSTGTVSLPVFSVLVVPPPPTISGTPTATAPAGRPYSFTPTATGATSFSIANKPAWAFFNTVNGALTGTPATAAAGSYDNITIRAINSGGSSALPPFSIAVPPPLPTLTGIPAGSALTGNLYRFLPSATYATSFSIVNKPTWASFDAKTGALTGTPTADAVGTFSNIAISAGNSTGTATLPAFSIKVAMPMPTISGSPATSVTAGRSYSFTPAVSDVTSFNIVNQPAWASFDTKSGALTGTPVNADAGTYSNIVISASNSTGTVRLPAFSVRVALPMPSISGAPLTKATVGTPYSFTPTATNATSFSIAYKPVWASFDSKTGTLSGTPGSANVTTYYSITIRAINSTGSVALPAFSIAVAPPPPTISGTPAIQATVAIPYSFTPTASNATSFSIVNKPSWASFSASTGTLSGTPGNANVGTYNNIAISASNGKTTATLPAFSLMVATGAQVAM